MTLCRSAAFALALTILAASPPARAQTPAPVDHKAEQKAASEAAEKAAKHGPAAPRLGDQGVIDLPKGALFVPKAEGERWLRAYGNNAGPDFLGLLFPTQEPGGWWATVEYVAAGHVSDDDAANWKADELLKNIQEGTLAGNEDRKARGFPPIEVTGWVEPPRYDKTTRRLVWSAMVRQIGGSGAGSINYNTYALGREGYYSVDFIAAPSKVEAAKAAAAKLLPAIRFDKGRAYDDFNASTDHLAEFGLAALVGGFALKKLGFLALAGAFALKFAKIIGVAVLAGGAAVAKLFKRRQPPAA